MAGAPSRRSHKEYIYIYIVYYAPGLHFGFWVCFAAARKSVLGAVVAERRTEAAHNSRINFWVLCAYAATVWFSGCCY